MTDTTTVPFEGFGPKALAFFEALKFHQSKAWFDENRDLWESDVMAPMVALIEHLNEEFARRDVPLRGDGRRAIFRVNRDIRFSKDKSPYKTHCGAALTRTGDKKDPGLLYIHIDPTGCFAAAGFHQPAPSTLAKLRKVMLARPVDAEALLSRLDKADLALAPFGQLTRMPRGFEALKDGPLDAVVRMKSLVVQEPLPAESITTPALAKTIVDFALRARPVLDFGWRALA